MSSDTAIRIQVVGFDMPIGPKIDAVLGEDGIEEVSDFEEMVQSVARLAIAHLGDSRFYPGRGVPWVIPQRVGGLPVFTSSDNPDDLARVEYLINRALSRDKRVVGVKTTVSVKNRATRQIGIISKIELHDKGLVEIEF